MAWQPNVTVSGVKPNTKMTMYADYSNLINELEQYMPEFKVSIKDLQEPSQTFVTNFYTDVLSEFFCDVNNLTEIQVTQNLTYCEMYSEIVPIQNMCTALRYVYSKLGLDDFGLNDICDPSPKRTYRLLQTMVNFIKYSDEKIHRADAKMKAVRSMKDKIDTLIKQKEIIINTINQKLLDCKQREAELKTVTVDVKTCKSELMNIHKHKDEGIQLLDKAKQEQEEIEKTCLKLRELKNNIVKDINALRAQIVEAPDLLKADHERLKQMKNEVIEKKSLMMAKVSEKKQINIILEQELAAHEKRLRLLVEIIEKNNKLTKLNHVIETIVQEKGEVDESSQSLKETIEIIERELADINNKINIFVNEMERDRNTFNSKYNALQKEKNEILEQKNQHCETVKLLENEINNSKLHIENLKSEVTTIMDQFEITRNILNQRQHQFNTMAIEKMCVFENILKKTNTKIF